MKKETKTNIKNKKTAETKEKQKGKNPPKKPPKNRPKTAKKEVKKLSSMQEETKKPEEKKITLNDLKKIKSISGMKISVEKEKVKIIKKEKQPEKKKEEEIKLPDNYLEEIEETFYIAKKKYDEIKRKLKERGFLSED